MNEHMSVDLIRNSLAFVSWKDRKAILPAISAIYRPRMPIWANRPTGSVIANQSDGIEDQHMMS